MMIQIPVENAVKHALREKEGERNLWVSVCRRGNGICIKITDNGGGYRPDSRNRGTGTGMKSLCRPFRFSTIRIRRPLMFQCTMSLYRVVRWDVR